LCALVEPNSQIYAWTAIDGISEISLNSMELAMIMASNKLLYTYAISFFSGFGKRAEIRKRQRNSTANNINLNALSSIGLAWNDLAKVVGKKALKFEK
jgi:hypothetical protein